MRVTEKGLLDSLLQHVQANRDRLGALQETVATGKAVLRPSDSPARASQALGLRSALEATAAFRETAEHTRAWMEATDQALARMLELAGRAQTLVEQGLSDTAGAQERATIAVELGALLEEAVGVANTSFNGDYLFAGFRVDTRPFTLVSGSPDTVVYSGDSGVIRRAIAPGHQVTVNVDGQAAFAPFFAALIQARDALQADDPATAAAALAGLQGAFQEMNRLRAENGGRQRTVQETMQALDRLRLTLEGTLSQTEDADMAEAISRLRHQETVYQAVLEAARRALNLPNLFEFLR